MHNPGHADHRFRRMPITDSGACRSLIPAMPITDSGHVDQFATRDHLIYRGRRWII
jgi:hypothetical protein